MMIYTSPTFKPRRKSKVKKVEKKKQKREFTPLKVLPRRPESSTDAIRSLDINEVPLPRMTRKERYVGEMAEREAKAQEEIERKKKMTAPIANKMGYQYIGGMPDDVIKTLGRKV